MSTAFDTLTAARALEAAGLEVRQAEASAGASAEIGAVARYL